MPVDEPMRFCASFIYGWRCSAPLAPSLNSVGIKIPSLTFKAFGSHVAQNSVALRSLPKIQAVDKAFR
jgi:hypothetical protein